MPELAGLAPALVAFTLAAVDYRAERPVIAVLLVVAALALFWPLAAEDVRASF